MKIIAIANQRGGVGKFTRARELSACCALRGYQTFVIDCAPQGNLTSRKIAGDDVARCLSYRLQPMESEVSVASSQFEKWEETFDLLFTELRIAAACTPSVSNLPAFLAEHLRRRLWKNDKQQLTEEGNSATTSATPSHAKLDTSKRPDCCGSGIYYPEGYNKGVARCLHARQAAPKHA